MATGNVHDRYMAGMNQSAHRGVAVWFDQHRNAAYRNAAGERLFENGRPYHSIVELKTKMPVGPVMPFGWEAPVEVPQQYIIKAIGKVTGLPASAGPILTTVVTDRIRIDYERMRADDEAACRAHWNEAVQKASQMGWEPPQYRKPMDPRLIALVGPAPRDPRIAQAFISGNPWALGFTDEVDVALQRLIALNRTDLMTPEEVEAEEEAIVDAKVARDTLALPDIQAEVRRLVAEALKDAKEKAPPRNKGGRPRKHPIPSETATVG